MIRDILAKDTICAIATPLGLGGIGIVRISGCLSESIAERVFVPSRAKFPLTSHRLYHGWIRNPRTDALIDEVLLSLMKAPHTYTREDVLEINCHSGYAVLEEILEIVMECGARLAEPGEFTYRAFLNGRIDLVQAEAVVDIVESRSKKSLEIARNQLHGAFSEIVQNWLELLADFISELEAHVDFAEDIDEELDLHVFAARLCSELIAPMERVLDRASRSRIVQEGVRLAIVGKPNVGKSSLLNALLQKDKAIVTEFAGTTRDVVEDYIILDGVLLKIMDTAGIREKADPIEQMGIERTLKVVESAHVIIWVLDRSVPLSNEDFRIFDVVRGRRILGILNKSDLPPAFEEDEVRRAFGSDFPVVTISVFRRDDVAYVKQLLRQEYLAELVDDSSEAFAINRRQEEHLRGCLDHLKEAQTLLEKGEFLELVLYELHYGKEELEVIVGKGHLTDDILDRVFSRFCIGK